MLLEQIFETCALYRHRVFADDRGSLVSLEAERNVPFGFERVYYVFGNSPGVERGFHAHRALHQWLVCVSGACTITVDDGHRRADVRLDSPDKGLHIGGLLWREMRDFTPGAVLMVIASALYDEADYIRDYDDFLAVVRGEKP